MRNTALEDITKKINLLYEAILGKPCTFTLYSWIDEWLNVYKAPYVKPYTLRSMHTVIRLHIKPHIEDKPLHEIEGSGVQKVLSSIPTSRTRKSAYDIFSASFRQAVKSKLIKDNPMDEVDTVKHKRVKGHALTVGEQNVFMEILGDSKYKPLYIFYLLTGCRMSEALSVKWSGVDFDNKRIHIPGSKTERSNRTVPMFPETHYLLSILPRSSEYVFPFTNNSVRLHFRKLKQKHNLTFSIHSLRHTFATRCLENGINPNTFQRWLGHSKPSTTLDIYSHVQPAFEKEEISKYKSKIETQKLP